MSNPLWREALKIHGVPFVRKTQNPNGSYVNDNYPRVLKTYESLKKSKDNSSKTTSNVASLALPVSSYREPSSNAASASLPISKPMTKAQQRKKQLNEQAATHKKYIEEGNRIGDIIKYCIAGDINKVGEILESYHPAPHIKLNMIERTAWFDKREMLDFLLSHKQFQDENYVHHALVSAINSRNPRNTITHLLEYWDADPSVITVHLHGTVVEPDTLTASGERVLDVIWDEERPTAPYTLSPYENKVWKEAIKLSSGNDLFGSIVEQTANMQQNTLAIFEPLLENEHMHNLNAIMYLMYMLNNVDPYDPYRYSPNYVGNDRERFLRIILPYVLDILEQEDDPYKQKKAATILYKKNYKEMTPEQRARLDAVLTNFRFMRNHGTEKNKLNLLKRLEDIPLEDQNIRVVSGVNAKLHKMNKVSPNIAAQIMSYKYTPRKKGGRNNYKKTRKQRY